MHKQYFHATFAAIELETQSYVSACEIQFVWQVVSMFGFKAASEFATQTITCCHCHIFGGGRLCDFESRLYRFCSMLPIYFSRKTVGDVCMICRGAFGKFGVVEFCFAIVVAK